MKQIIGLLLLTLIREFSYCQFINPINEDSSIFKTTNDSLIRKFIDKIDIVTDKNVNGKMLEFQIPNELNKVIMLPDSSRQHKANLQSIRITFKGYLYDYFESKDLDFENEFFKKFDFNEEEKFFLNEIKRQKLDKVYEMGGFQNLFLSNRVDGGQMFESFDKTYITAYYYSFYDYHSIKCTINYSPVYADVYVIGKKDWIYDFQLSEPPSANEITKEVLKRLSNFKISKGPSPFTINLNEKAYIIMYVRNGSISFDHIEPSTINKLNNSIVSKLDR